MGVGEGEAGREGGRLLNEARAGGFAPPAAASSSSNQFAPWSLSHFLSPLSCVLSRAKKSGGGGEGEEGGVT
eukprot:933792-Rhodomonas_salina.1